MPGKRQTTDTIKANGRKHLSAAEEAERRAREVRVPAAEKIEAPKTLSAARKKEFVRIAEQLAKVNLFTELDADALSSYVVAFSEYQKATKEVDAALKEKNVGQAAKWSLVQDRFSKQARAHANDLGLTVTSRCRLVMPKQETADDDDLDEFTAALLDRQKRASGG